MPVLPGTRDGNRNQAIRHDRFFERIGDALRGEICESCEGTGGKKRPCEPCFGAGRIHESIGTKK